MTQREAFEAWALQGGTHPGATERDEIGYVVSVTAACWAAWQAATRHAAKLALVAPCKTDRQDQREACANWILGGME